MATSIGLVLGAIVSRFIVMTLMTTGVMVSTITESADPLSRP